MESLMHYLSSHPLAIVALIAVGLIVLYFIFKQLVKMAILFALILLGMAGYFYFKGTKSVRDALEKTKAQTQEVVEKGKGAYEKGKNIYEKGKSLTASDNKTKDKAKEKKKRDND